MRLQLERYLADRDQFEAEIGDLEWYLPATLKAIRSIQKTLVPQRDRSSVEETFNVDMLMQQFRKGVADLEKLALWLLQLLKYYCAPIRDNWVDQMVTQLSNGDLEQLVLGMRNLLGVLEAMKFVGFQREYSLPVLLKLVDNYTLLTNLQIFETATAPKPVPGSMVGSLAKIVMKEITEIATRIAHMGTLHFRVWGPFAYLVNPEEVKNSN